MLTGEIINTYGLRSELFDGPHRFKNHFRVISGQAHRAWEAQCVQTLAAVAEPIRVASGCDLLLAKSLAYQSKKAIANVRQAQLILSIADSFGTCSRHVRPAIHCQTRLQ